MLPLRCIRLLLCERLPQVGELVEMFEAGVIELLQRLQGRIQRQAKLLPEFADNDSVQCLVCSLRGLQGEFEYHLIAVRFPHRLTVELPGSAEESLQPLGAQRLSGSRCLRTIIAA